VSEPQEKAPYVIWQPSGAPALLGDPIVQCLILIALTSAVFLAFPGIDIWFSNLFYKDGFLAGQLRGFNAFRDLWRNMTVVIIVALVVVPLIKIIWPSRRSLLKPRDVAFILSTLIVGPGIITNLILKDNWGRPRPFMVDIYGGHVPFAEVWQITHYCTRNCSFVSGEGSSATWLVTLAVLLPPRFRGVGITLLAAFGAAFALNRVIIGAHFLSDVVLAGWITLLVMAVGYRVFYVNPPQALTNESMEAWLTEFGVNLRRAAAGLGQAITRRKGNRGEGR
jgi:lipid A 4'-phosphatase